MTGQGRRDGRLSCRRTRGLAGVLALALASLTGCAAMDEFSIKHMNFEVFREPTEPLQVIKNSTDGAARARAIRCLREPLLHGAGQKEQDVYVSVLSYTAAHDQQVVCRLAAIAMLRHYRDPRAADALREAYYRSGSFPPETARILRCQALAALGETRQPVAVELLVRVLREPPVEGADVDRLQKFDERIAAARALGNFQHYQATSALAEVMRSEPDTEQSIALRSCAHQSLVQATGKDLPPDPVAWERFLNNAPNGDALPRQPSVGERILQLTGLR